MSQRNGSLGVIGFYIEKEMSNFRQGTWSIERWLTAAVRESGPYG